MRNRQAARRNAAPMLGLFHANNQFAHEETAHEFSAAASCNNLIRCLPLPLR